MNEIITTNVVTNDLELNRDPLTGTPGAHPMGTGIGAAAGGLAGAVAGMSIGGPEVELLVQRSAQSPADSLAAARAKLSTRR